MAYEGRHKCAKNEICHKCNIEHTVDNPYCFVQPLTEDILDAGNKKTQKKKIVRYVYFDIEATQTTRNPLKTNSFKHEANLLIADVICEKCINAGITFQDSIITFSEECVCGIPKKRHVEKFGGRRQIYHNFDDETLDVVEQFLDFLLNTGPQNILTVVISHNGGRYDIHMCLERLHDKNVPVNLIMTGLKIYSAEIRGNHTRQVIFKDSCNFFCGPLSGLPKTFGIQNIVKDKPFFPHYYNKKENLNIVRSSLPPTKYYGVKYLKPKTREDFINWYNTNKNTQFTLKDQLVEYCENDVDILRESCLKFHKLYMDVAHVKPFLVASTIAKLALHIYRKLFLKKNTMINCPEKGYSMHQLQSIAALRYMRLYEETHHCQVQTARWSIGEEKVQDTGYRLDGLVQNRSRNRQPLAIEFLGCYYHGL